MKKLIITAVLAAIPMFGFAQKEFDKFIDKEGVDTVVLTQNLIDLVGSVQVEGAEEAQGYLKKVKSMDSMRIFVTEDRLYAKELKETADSYLKKHKMDELMSVKKDGRDVKIYMATGKSSSLIKELLLFSTNPKDNETVVVSFIGEIDLNTKESK